MDATILVAILTSVAAALFYSLVAFGKSWLKEPESFEPKKFGRTIVQAIFIGIYLYYIGLAVTAETLLTGEAWIVSIGLNSIIDLIVLFLLRFVNYFKQQ